MVSWYFFSHHFKIESIQSIALGIIGVGKRFEWELLENIRFGWSCVGDQVCILSISYYHHDQYLLLQIRLRNLNVSLWTTTWYSNISPLLCVHSLTPSPNLRSYYVVWERFIRRDDDVSSLNVSPDGRYFSSRGYVSITTLWSAWRYVPNDEGVSRNDNYVSLDEYVLRKKVHMFRDSLVYDFRMFGAWNSSSLFNGP